MLETKLIVAPNSPIALAKEYKIGYFVMTAEDGYLLVRTFLFITTEQTREGRRLASLTHLNLLDKRYLGIDRMDAFMTYNILGDPVLRALFEKAGCGSLMKYLDMVYPEGSEPLKPTDFIHKYLGNIF